MLCRDMMLMTVQAGLFETLLIGARGQTVDHIVFVPGLSTIGAAPRFASIDKRRGAPGSAAT